MKKVLLILLIILGIVLIVPAFLPKDFALERQVVINKPVSEVYAYVSSLEKQNDWSVWGKLDPNMKKEFRGVDRTVGSVSAWDGNDDVGKGEQEIVNMTLNERIDFELRFMKPFKAVNKAYIITKADNDSVTTVVWGFSGRMPYPMNAMMLFYSMEKGVGVDYEKGLANLKELLESTSTDYPEQQ